MSYVSTRAVALTVAVLLLAAYRAIAAPPVGKKTGSAEPLAGTNWTLVTLGGQAPLSDTTVTLRFASSGSVSGSDGCNVYHGSYSVDGTTICFGSEFVSSQMACPEAIMSQAKAYSRALQRAAAYAVDADRLLLRVTGDNELAVFAAQDITVVGTSWKVTAYNDGQQAVVSVITGTEITATFGADDRLAGSAGCNNYFASYRVDGEAIAIGVPGTTRKACAEPEGVMEQERLYLGALRSAATFQVDGDKMHLRTTAGALAVTLVARPVVTQ